MTKTLLTEKDLLDMQESIERAKSDIEILSHKEIIKILKALLGKASEDFGDNLEKEFGIRAVQESNNVIREYRNKLYSK
jgi:hypothetical protein